MFETNSYYSAYPEYAGKTLDWMPSDTEALYNINTKKSNKHTASKLKSLGFTNNNVKYEINNYGFRGSNFNKHNNICFIGCSITFGIGLNLQDTFSQLIADKLNMNNCNLALAGGSMDACFRIGSFWLPQLKPDVTVILAPVKERSEIFYDNEFQSLLPSLTRNNKWYLNYLKNANNTTNNFLKNKLALKQLCQDINTKLLYLEIETWNFDSRNDLARDLMHPGKKSPWRGANTTIRLINELAASELFCRGVPP